MFKTYLSIILIMLCALGGFAQNVTVDGIDYTLSGRNATVSQGAYSGAVVIPSYIQVEGAFYDVTAVADRCFRDNHDLESVTFESTELDFLGVATFENCDKLTSITMPQMSSQLGEWSFAGCSSLAKINIPEGITALGNSMFKNCVELTEITLPSTLGTIYIDVFANTPKLSVVYLNSESAPAVQSSPITSGATVVIPDGYKDGYASTWAGAIILEKSDFEHPSSYTTLKTYIEMLSESGASYEAGTAPGAYPADKVEAFETALMQGILMLDGSHTEEEYAAAYDNIVKLREELEQSFNPITDGYYYIVNAYTAFLETQEVEKAMTVDGNNLAWDTIDRGNPNFVFHITPQGNDTYTIQNFGTGKYINASASASASQVVKMSLEPKTLQTITPIGALQWVIANKFCDITYHPENHGNGSGQKGNIVTYNDNKQNMRSTWYLTYVDQEAMDSLENIKDIMLLNTKLENLVDEAQQINAKTIAYQTTPINVVANDDPTKSQIISNAKDPQEGTYASLTDGDISGETFFHSTYHEDPGVPHYLQIALNSPVNGFEAMLARRSGSYGRADAPATINVYASNDTTQQWNFIKAINIQWPAEGTAYTPNVQFDQDYSFLRLEVIKTNENRHNADCEHPFFTLAEIQLYSKTLDNEHSQYNYIPGMKQAVDKMNQTVDQSLQIIADNKATQADIDALRADIDAVLSLFVDTTKLSNAIAQAESYTLHTTVGDGFGETTQEALDALQTALNTAKSATATGTPNKAAVDEATQLLTQAISEFLASVKTIQPNTWYYISSTAANRTGDPGEDDARCLGNVIYAQGHNEGDHIVWGLNEEQSEAYHYNPYAMWQFIAIEGTDTYAVQNLGNGFYMGQANGSESKVRVSYEAVPYKVNFLGGGQFELVPANDDNTLSLHAKGADNTVVTYRNDGVNTASAWTFTTVLDDDDMIVYPGVLYNFTDVICLPFAISDVQDYNEDVQTFAVKKMTQETIDGELVTTIELYQKDSFEAGEPFIAWIGDPEQEHSEYFLTLPFPETVNNTPLNGNGIVGCIHGQGFGKGTAFSTGHAYTVATEGVGIGAQTGVIDPSTYRGEVEGVETALTLTLTGLNPIGTPTDVNGDGQVNSSDVVAVYNFILRGDLAEMPQAKADTNGDGQVNSADVIYIYNAIIGSSANSRAFIKRINASLQ